MRHRRILTIGLLLLALIPGAALAAWTYRGLEPVLPVDAVYSGDYLVAGQEVRIEGNVDGDVIAAGNSVVVSGKVSGDVIAAGQAVTVSGSVGGSVRVAGNTVRLDGAVGRNVTVFAGAVTLGAASRVERNVYASAGAVEALGTVARELNVRAPDVVLAGTTTGAVNVELGSGGRLEVRDGTTLGGALSYWADAASALQRSAGATFAQEPQFKPLPPPLPPFHPVRLFGHLVRLFGLLVVGLVFVTMAPRLVRRLTDELLQRPVPAIGWGLVVLVLTPVLAAALLLTLIGIPLALILLAGYAMALYTSQVVASLGIGQLFVGQLPVGKSWPPFALLIIGTVGFVVLTAVPVFGGFLKLLLVLWGLGATLKVKRQILREVG